GHAVAAVFTWSEQESTLLEAEPTFFGPAESFTDEEGRGIDGQVQDVSRFGPLTLVSGLSYARADVDGMTGFIFPEGRLGTPASLETRHVTGYAYGTLSLGGNDRMPGRIQVPGLGQGGVFGVPITADLTLGLSVDRFRINQDDGDLDETETTVSPKAGLRIDFGSWMTLRGGWMRAVTPDTLVLQRLEPQTVAGLTQLTDARGGVPVTTYGGGIDLRPHPRLELGVEGLERRLARAPTEGEGRDERQSELRFHADAILSDRLTATLGFERIVVNGSLVDFTDLDDYAVTEATVGMNWFDPSGFFLTGRVGVAHHRSGINDGNVDGIVVERDTFPVSTVTGGYRLPKGQGVVSLELRNVTGSDFGFEDRPGLSGSLISEPRYSREFSAVGRVTLSF
ncbi:MAG: hypothetical protein AAF899_13105, partial [Pseudomonadota bacterium]